MQKSSIDLLPAVLDARNIAEFLNIGYVKSLKLIRFGGLSYIRLGRVYRVTKENFIEWLNCKEPMIIDLD